MNIRVVCLFLSFFLTGVTVLFAGPLRSECNCSGKPVAPLTVKIHVNDVPAPSVPFSVTVSIESASSFTDASLVIHPGPGLTIVSGQLSWKGALEPRKPVEIESFFQFEGVDSSLIAATGGVFEKDGTRLFKAVETSVAVSGAVLKAVSKLAIVDRDIPRIIEVRGVER